MTAVLREVRFVLRERSALLVLALGVLAIAVAASLPLRPMRVRAEAVRLAQSEDAQKQAKVISAVRKSEPGFHAPMGYEMPGVLETREKLYNFEAVQPPAPLGAAVMPLPNAHPEKLSVHDHNDEHPSLFTGGGRLLSNVTAIASPASPLGAASGNFDLLFVVTAVLPLLIIGLASDLIASDAATGALRLLLAQGAAIDRLLFSRMLARMLLSLVPWLLEIAVLVAWVQFRAAGTVPWGRLVAWTGIAGLYLAMWFLLCLAVNARFRAPLRTALPLFAAWTVLVFLVPAGIGLALRVFRPAVPSLLLSDREKSEREAVNETMEAAYTATMESFHRETGIYPFKVAAEQRPRYNELLRATPFALPHGNAVLDCYFHKYPAPAQQAMHYQQYYAAQIGRDCLMAERFGGEIRRAEAAALAQKRAAGWLRLLSPMLLTRFALATVAGAEQDRYDAFLDQFDGFLRRREEFFGRHMRAYTPIFSTELARCPLFHFEEPALAVSTPLRYACALLVFDLFLLWAARRTSLHRKGAAA